VAERKHLKCHILKEDNYAIDLEISINLNRPHPNPPQGEGVASTRF
jgi:hypothetical protein